MCRGFLGLQNRAVEIIEKFIKDEWIELGACNNQKDSIKHLRKVFARRSDKLCS